MPDCEPRACLPRWDDHRIAILVDQGSNPIVPYQALVIRESARGNKGDAQTRTVLLSAFARSDLASTGFGTNWGQTFSWTNGPSYAATTFNCNGTVDAPVPYLRQNKFSTEIVVISNGVDALLRSER